MSNKQKTLIFILIASALTGATSTVTKIGLVNFPPLTFAFIRFLIAGIVISPFLFKKNFLKALLQLAPISFLGALNIIVFILGIKLTTATIGQLLYAGIPLLIALFLFALFKERIVRNKEIGVLIGFLGVLIVILLPIFEKGNKFSGTLLGNLLIGVGVICSSLYNIYSKRRQQFFSPFIITAAFIWTTAIVLLPLFLWESSFHFEWWKNLTSSSIISLLYIAIFSTIIIYLLIQYAIRHGGSVSASMQYYLAPIFAYVFASLILGEQLTLGLFVGGTLALLGVYIATKK